MKRTKHSNESRAVSCNVEQGLFVIPESGGYSCLGFDVAFDWATKVALWCGSSAPWPEMKGTLEGYAQYRRIMADGGAYATRTGSRCPALLDKQLIGLEGKRVEVKDCYGNVRRFIVGKSTGWLPIHLEIATRASSGGCGTIGAPYEYVKVISR